MIVFTEALSEDEANLEVVISLLGEVGDAELALELLRGLEEGLEGRRLVEMPAGWPAAFAKLSRSNDPEVRQRATALALVFGDPRALRSLKRTLLDPKADPASRRRALRWLTERRVAGLAPILHGLLGDPELRRPVLLALASYDHPDTAEHVLRRYPGLSPREKEAALGTLTSRPRYGLALLGAIGEGRVPARELTALHARQLRNLEDERVDRKLREVWGDVRRTPREKKALIAGYKGHLTEPFLAEADLRRGRLLFRQTCEKCHRLYDAGAAIGPELTGSNRGDLDYILENILDPSAMIGKDYRLSTLVTRRGRVVSGIVKDRTSRRITMQTENELLTFPMEDVQSLNESPISMMPEGLLEDLSREEVRDLIAYLATKTQVPLPPEGTNDE